MKIKVIGKAHLQGTSKRTGRDYNFIQVHYTAPSYGVEGEAALTASLDPARYSLSSILVGSVYNLEFDNRGYVVGFDLVSPGK